ncbi:MAG: acyl carrier protein phosphodiesterase [Flavobacteriaceae bacterium]|nr:acyl carrier protein phosphodiesterase [Flavobacteriaceae bacterium]
MNFLAHIYLSGDNDLIRIGNFMADSIKGRKFQNYPSEMQVGILLHREIDTFTDVHPTVRNSTKRLHKKYGHYSGVIVDILYDHFLAKNWNDYSNVPLDEFVEEFYDSLKDNYDLLTKRVKNLMPYMIEANWLVSYAEIDGIKKVLQGMNRRTGLKSGMDMAVEDLRKFYVEFEDDFKQFFPDLIEFSNLKLSELNKLYATN